MTSAAKLLQTKNTRLRRKPDRGTCERETVNAILDEGFVCHLAFVSQNQPYALPSVYGRAGDRLLVHGAHAGRMLRTLGAGARICVTVTLVDGLVLAPSARMHSVNYRSVVILGMAKEITDNGEKTLALRHIVEHVMPGRWQQVRPPNEKELQETSVLEIPIMEGSAKIRSGPPLHTAQDSALRVWSGEVPLRVRALEPVTDSQGVPLPPNIQDYLRKWGPR
jgi:nitroimidazol reductase NimA-like FMN-containing flavoprotein (pyridoxamine 5'-phosphate oxidase superfamily)